MKKHALLLVILKLNIQVFCQEIQEIRFDLHGNYTRSTTNQKLTAAQTLNDISLGFPTNWISDSSYISSEISTTYKGVIQKESALNDHLSSRQKNLLASAEVGTEISIEVRYRQFNPEAKQNQVLKINYSVTVIPEIEAEFAEGKNTLEQYLKKTAIQPVERIRNEGFKRAIVRFTINETGEISEAQMMEESGNSKADQIVLTAIRKMPKWRPAKNAAGKPIKQDFKFSVSGLKEGC